MIRSKLAHPGSVLLTLTLAYTVSMSDQGLVGILLEPIKQSLSVSDSQLGVLTGMAFALLYAAAGLPAARWADRGNRVAITSLALGVWSFAVGACVFAGSFSSLIGFRMLAAVGAAAVMPPTYSLVGDYFSSSNARTRAMTIYTSANTLSLCASFILGGYLGARYDWRVAFGVLGALGLLVSVVFSLGISELRTECLTSKAPEGQLKDVFPVLFRTRATRHISLALIVLFTMGYGLAPWYAAFMIRSHGASTGELGFWFGLILGIGGLVGTLAGGFFSATRLQSNERGQLRMVAFATGLTTPCLALFLLAHGKGWALAAFVPFTLLLNVFFGPTFTLLQRLVPDSLRASVLAALMLLCNLIGMGLGPQIVGSLSDALTALWGADSLRIAMLVMSCLALWAAYHFWRAAQTIADDLPSNEAVRAGEPSATTRHAVGCSGGDLLVSPYERG